VAAAHLAAKFWAGGPQQAHLSQGLTGGQQAGPRMTTSWSSSPCGGGRGNDPGWGTPDPTEPRGVMDVHVTALGLTGIRHSYLPWLSGDADSYYLSLGGDRPPPLRPAVRRGPSVRFRGRVRRSSGRGFWPKQQILHEIGVTTPLLKESSDDLAVHRDVLPPVRLRSRLRLVSGPECSWWAACPFS
jgi:hypothetical protein